MRVSLLVAVLFGLLVCCKAQRGNPHGADVEDNDFAEFEEFDEEETDEGDATVKTEEEEDGEFEPEGRKSMQQEAETADDEDAIVEDDDEFEHFTDEEEFEGFDKDSKPINKGSKTDKAPDLKITNIPAHLRTHWDSFYLEMLMLAGLGVYFLNFLAGKSKNHKIAQSWLSAHKDILESNFQVVGDDGSTKEVQQGVLMKESEHVYSLWCSGRTYCEGMLIEMRLLKRQDIIQTISRIFKPAQDQVVIKVTMDEGSMSPFVCALALKKSAAKLQRDMNDLSVYCPERKSGTNIGLSDKYQVMSEIFEATQAAFDSKVLAVIKRFEGVIEYLHFSDQFSGPKVNTEEGETTKMPETKRVLIFSFNIPDRVASNPKSISELQELLKMVFHCIDKMKRINLSPDARSKSMRNRKRVEEAFLKQTHNQRVEAAQQRREDKRRDDKERMMNEEDPDKQRKWEERNDRRDKKKSQAKMKMMKVKAM